MGLPSYMWSVFDRNVVMRRVIVHYNRFLLHSLPINIHHYAPSSTFSNKTYEQYRYTYISNLVIIETWIYPDGDCRLTQSSGMWL